MESFLNRFTEIGFFQSKPETWTGAGWSREYKYYPEYFDDKHYTLVIYTHGTNTQISPSSEYRLYLHSTKDLKYIKSEFQGRYFESSYDSLHFITCRKKVFYYHFYQLSKMKMEDEFNRLFKLEIREKNLKIILE
jgi:hypothetical protein